MPIIAPPKARNGSAINIPPASIGCENFVAKYIAVKNTIEPIMRIKRGAFQIVALSNPVRDYRSVENTDATPALWHPVGMRPYSIGLMIKLNV
jgi:hypothetical protein